MQKQKVRSLTQFYLLGASLCALWGAHPSAATAQQVAKPATITGWLNSIWSEPFPGQHSAKSQVYLLKDDNGKSYEVSINQNTLRAAGGHSALNRRRVVVSGVVTKKAYGTRSVAATDALQVSAIKLQSGTAIRGVEGAPQLQVGAKPYINILCRFSDNSSTPTTISYISGLMSSTPPGLDHYWRETSYNNINLAGSNFVGWYTLPHTRDYYVGGNINPPANLDLLAQDATAAAAADVPNFTSYYGINIILNGDLGDDAGNVGSAWGGSTPLTLNGVTKNYGVTWLPNWAWTYQSVVAHEMGHSLGFDHSSGPYATPYDSDWDMMSNTYAPSACPAGDPYLCNGVHTNSYHTNNAGWIPAARKYTALFYSQKKITLEELDQPGPGNYMMAKIPIPNSTLYYTVEARRTVGYDAGIPGAAVIIHKVDESLPDRQSQVVDPDGNGDPNDAGAMWEPGETWNDSANNISVSVNEATPTGFTVTITNQTPDLVPPTISLTSPVDGSLVTAMPAIYGTAQDDPLGRGLQQVSVTIQRNSDGLYWNGSTWSGPITDLPTNLFGINGWSLNSVPLPTGANLADGKYTIVATAMDVAGNTASAVATISVDATPPNISMTAPVTGSAQSISIISGTAIDTPAGSGLQRVVVSILRSKDGQYWTGSGWTATPTALPATLNSDSTWVVSSLVLPGSALLDSDYAVTAAAIDYAGNVGVASAKVTVNSGLRIFMNAPINNGAVHDFAVAVGTATENAGNSGIVGVIVSIQRTGDKAYWNGIGWTATPSGVPAVYNSSNGTWSFNSSSALPQGANLLDGPYVFSATAIDRIGNMVTTSVAVTVDATAPQVSIASPANNVYVRKFPVVVGKADDNPGGTGIDHVDLMIKRYDGVYWNGTLWTEAPSVLETLRSNDDWSFTTEASPIAGLSDGQYTLTAIAYDKAGGSSSASRTLVLDSTAPQAPIITTPTNNTFVKRFGTIQGLASDNVSGNGVTRATGVNGSGVSHVDLNIQRRSDGKWWSGGSWSDTPIGIPTSFANGKWTRNSGFPAGSYLSDGQYTITPITYDKAGNRTVGSSTTLTVDETAPNLTFVRPGLNSGAKSVPVVQGTVDDGTGSGVKEVTLSIQRRTDGKYWSGSTWAIKQTQLTTALSGGTWSRRTGLPTGADLPAGNYYFIAQATDKIGNMRRLVSAVSVDTTGPSTVTFTTPRADATIGSLATVIGTAVDNNGGSGIDHVELTIQRQKDGLFWSGLRWSALRTVLTTKLTGSVWKSNTNLLASNIGSGTYTLTATAFDKAGNSAGTSIKVSGGPASSLSADTNNGVASSVKLSITAAHVAGDSLQLRFTGALDADTASDAAHYSVTVNGQTVVAESAGYNAATHSVLLALPVGSLRLGDTVRVSYQGLLDSSGATVNGRSALVPAR